MFKTKGIAITLMGILLSIYSFARQAGPAVEDKTDFMRSNGKIYVVMAVVVTIVGGLLIYIINLDRKIRKLEKNSKD